MTSASPISLLKYFSSFRHSLGGLAALGVVPALLSSLKPDWGAYLFPPLGDLDQVARVGAILLGFIAICSGYLLIDRPYIRTYILISSAVTAVSLILYLTSTSMYVRRIDVPSRGSAIFVSVGAKRSDYAMKVFGSESDWEMLKDRGPSEEEIYNLWTPNSIRQSRLSLYLPYLGILLGWTFCFSAFTALDLSKGSKLSKADAKT